MTMGALRNFAYVLRPFMHRLQQTAQPFGERDVTNAAPETARLLEIRLGESARRTFLRRRAFLDLFRRADPKE